MSGWTTIRCKTCGEVITRYKGHIGAAERLRRIRKHYMEYHPEKFRAFVKKGAKKRKKKR